MASSQFDKNNLYDSSLAVEDGDSNEIVERDGGNDVLVENDEKHNIFNRVNLFADNEEQQHRFNELFSPKKQRKNNRPTARINLADSEDEGQTNNIPNQVINSPGLTSATQEAEYSHEISEKELFDYINNAVLKIVPGILHVEIPKILHHMMPDIVEKAVSNAVAPMVKELKRTIEFGFKAQMNKATKMMTAVKQPKETANMMWKLNDLQILYKNQVEDVKNLPLLNVDQIIKIMGIDFTNEVENVYGGYGDEKNKFGKQLAWLIFGFRLIRFFKLSHKEDAKKTTQNAPRGFMWNKCDKFMKLYDAILRRYFEVQIQPYFVLYLNDEFKKLNANPTEENNQQHEENMAKQLKETELQFFSFIYEKVNQAAIDAGHYRIKRTDVWYWRLLEKGWVPYSGWKWQDEIIVSEYLKLKNDRQTAGYKGHKKAYMVLNVDEGPDDLLKLIRSEQKRIYHSANSQESDSDLTDDGMPPMKNQGRKKKQVSLDNMKGKKPKYSDDSEYEPSPKTRKNDTPKTSQKSNDSM